MNKTSKELVKRLLAVALTLVMVIGFMPVAAIPVYATEVGAEETPEPSAEPSTEPTQTPAPTTTPEITDVKVTPYVGEYDGEEHDAAEVVSAAGDVVKYKLDNREETTDCPKIKDVKEYSLTVTVQREGYKDYTETVYPEISYKYDVTLNVADGTTYSGKDYDLLKSNPVIVTTAKDGKKVSSKDYNVSYEVNYTDNSGSGEPKTLDEPIGKDAGTYTITAKVKVKGYEWEIAVTGEVRIEKAKADFELKIYEKNKEIKPTVENGKNIVKSKLEKKDSTIKYDFKTVQVKDALKPADDAITLSLKKDGKQLELDNNSYTFREIGTYTLKAEVKGDNNYEDVTKEIIIQIDYDKDVPQIEIVSASEDYVLGDNEVINITYRYINGGFGKTSAAIKLGKEDVTSWFTINTGKDSDNNSTFTLILNKEHFDDFAELLDENTELIVTLTKAASSEYIPILPGLYLPGLYKESPETVIDVSIKAGLVTAETVGFKKEYLVASGTKDNDNEWYRAPAKEGEVAFSVSLADSAPKKYTISATAGGAYGESCNIEKSSEPLVVYVKETESGKVAKVKTEWKVDLGIPEVKINANTKKDPISGIIANITFGILEKNNGKTEYEVSFETEEDLSGVKSVYYTARYASLAEIEKYYETLAVWNEWTKYEIEHGKWEAWTEYNKDRETWQGDPPEEYTGEEPKKPDSSKPLEKPASPFNIENEEISTADDNGTFTARIDTSAYYIIEYWVEDNAGNISDHHFLGNYEVEYDENGNVKASQPYNYLVVDDEAPDITIDCGDPFKTDDDGIAYYADNVTITVNVVEVNYKLSQKLGEPLVVYINNVRYDKAEPELTVNGNGAKITYQTGVEDGTAEEFTISAEYKDPSGNTPKDAVDGKITKTIKVDKEFPEVKIEQVKGDDSVDPWKTYDGDDKVYYYNTDANFKATVKDTNKDETTVTVRNAKSAISKQSEDGSVAFTIKGTANEEIQLESAVSPKQGDISATHKDKAGNTTSVNFDGTVVIDMLKPSLKVTLNNAANTVGGTHYYNGSINAAFEVTETYFASDLMQVKVKGEESNNIGLTFDPENGTNHKATHTLTEDGNYKLVVTGADKAGNEMDKYESEDLVIDTQITAPTIGGVEPGHAYKDNDISVSVTGDDANFDVMTVTIEKTYMTVENGKNVQRTVKVYDEAFYGKGTYSYRVPDGRDADGIYVVTATIRDKATNTATSTPVTFTVNRCGSVFEYKDGVSDVNGAYVPAVGKDLVIWEYSATPLEGSEESQIKNVGIYADGSEIDASDIKVELEHQNGGWYKYIYTIPAANFDTDAHYKVEISSESINGVRSSNTKIQNLVAIDFFKDGTAPVLENVTGMEKSIYNEAEHEIKFNIYDSIGLASVKVLVNDTEVFVKEDFEDAMNYEGSVTLDESDSKQHVRFIITDLAGNVTDTDADGFDPAYTFERDLVISTNLWVRLRANTPLLIGCIAGVVVILALGVILIIRKKDKKEEEKTAAAK